MSIVVAGAVVIYGTVHKHHWRYGSVLAMAWGAIGNGLGRDGILGEKFGLAAQ
jgi:hypothetical protein